MSLCREYYAECHYAECHYAECHYAECHYDECHDAKCYYAECNMLCVIMMNAIMLSVMMLNVITLNGIMMNVIMLSVIMLSVMMLNVMAPQCYQTFSFDRQQCCRKKLDRFPVTFLMVSLIITLEEGAYPSGAQQNRRLWSLLVNIRLVRKHSSLFQ